MRNQPSESPADPVRFILRMVSSRVIAYCDTCQRRYRRATPLLLFNWPDHATEPDVYLFQRRGRFDTPKALAGFHLHKVTANLLGDRSLEDGLDGLPPESLYAFWAVDAVRPRASEPPDEEAAKRVPRVIPVPLTRTGPNVGGIVCPSCKTERPSRRYTKLVADADRERRAVRPEFYL